MKITQLEDLQKIKQEELAKEPKSWVKVGFSSCGIAAGAREVFAVLQETAAKHHIDVAVRKCGCIGLCSAEPLVEVNVEGLPRVFYGKVDKDTAVKIVEEHLQAKKLVSDHIYSIKFNG
jgi:(2Fe-2S) ferredoxin